MSFYSLVTASRLSAQSSCVRSESSHDQPRAPHLTQFHQRVITELRQKRAKSEHRLSERACPLCRNRFVQVEIDRVPLDYCQACGGLWFDSRELMHFTRWFEDISDGDVVERASTLPCPVCGRLLRECQLSLNSNLIVHACPQQHGVFLEDGEFERALEVSDQVDELAGSLNDQHLAVWRQLQCRLATGEFVPSRLRCAECGQHTVTVSVDEVELDYCTQCQSCWFDQNELQHFTEQPRDVPGDHLRSRASLRVCPRCGRQLRQYQFHPRSNLMVEACPAAHGVYLRHGQFPRVLKASE